MKTLKFFLLLFVFIILFCFAYANTDQVNFHIPLGPTYIIPLMVLLLAVFAIGALLGILSILFPLFRTKSHLKKARKDLHKSNQVLQHIQKDSLQEEEKPREI